MIKLLLTLAILSPSIASAFSYEVDMPNSNDPSYEMIRIKIDNCESKFKIKKSEFRELSDNPDILKKLVKKAIQRSSNGCADE